MCQDLGFTLRLRLARTKSQSIIKKLIEVKEDRNYCLSLPAQLIEQWKKNGKKRLFSTLRSLRSQQRNLRAER